jgi:Arm DNA-binding domain
VLTALKIKTAKPAERPYKIADGGGLFLLVQPNGSKLWRYKFRIHGVEGLQGLGAFPEVGLAQARVAHCVFRRSVTDRFGIVTAEFGNVTDHFGDVTEGTVGGSPKIQVGCPA